MPLKEKAKEIVESVIEVFESKDTSINIFTEIVQLSLDEKPILIGHNSEDKEMEELADWVRLNAKKIHLLEKVRRALVLSGMSADIIREELLGVYRMYTKKPEYRL